MDTEPKRKRRWYQFSLRTLLIGVTLVCIFGGWAASQETLVRNRKGALDRAIERHYVEVTFRYYNNDSRNPVPWFRRILGDEGVYQFVLASNTPLEERRLLRGKFPEARLRWQPEQTRWDNLERFSDDGDDPPDAPVVKVAVFADGRLTVDGKPSTVDGLRESLRSLSDKHGAVWYYREGGQQEPPPIAMEVMKTVAEARLPIRLSSRPDYSDSVGP
jgi:hypothetical protein